MSMCIDVRVSTYATLSLVSYPTLLRFDSSPGNLNDTIF